MHKKTDGVNLLHRPVIYKLNSYCEIALTGQVDTHVPHSTQAAASTFAFPSAAEIADTGQADTQDSQPTHTS